MFIEWNQMAVFPRCSWHRSGASGFSKRELHVGTAGAEKEAARSGWYNNFEIA